MNESNSWSRNLLESLLFLLLAAALLFRIIDADIWYHLSIGREVMRLGALPAGEFLVYPNANLPGAYHEWGYGVLVYLVQRLGGYTAMGLFNALVCTLMFWVLFRASGRAGVARFFGFLLLIPLYFWMEARLMYRVEIFLYLALAAEIWLLERFLAGRDWRLLAPIPLLGLLLAQLHPSVIMLVLVLGAYGLQLLWQCRQRREDVLRYAGWLALCGGATLLLAMLNPYGWHQVLLPFTLAGEKRVTMMVVEFLPSLKSPDRWKFVALLAFSVLAMAAHRRRRVVDAILFLGFAYLAWRYVRNIGLLALVMYVPLGRGLTDGLGRLRERFAITRPAAGGPRPGWAWGIVLAVAFALFLTFRLAQPTWGLGLPPGLYPEVPARMINDLQPPGRIFNYYEMGGYLGWMLDGRYQVSVDGRHYRADRSLALHKAVVYARPGWQTGLKRYDVNTIVIPATRSFQAQPIPIVSVLASDPEWLLAGAWDHALLFFRRGAVPDLLAGFYRDKRAIWEQMLKEARAWINLDPGSAPAYQSLGDALWALGQLDEASVALRHYLELVPQDSKVTARLQELEAERARRHN